VITFATLAIVVSLGQTAGQTLPADRITYDQLVNCAATWRLTSIRASVADDMDTGELAQVQVTAFQVLARLYGQPLNITEPVVDLAIRDKAVEKLTESQRFTTDAGRRLFEQQLTIEQRICAAVAERVARDNAALSGTS
jgi:hypothetical protein